LQRKPGSFQYLCAIVWMADILMVNCSHFLRKGLEDRLEAHAIARAWSEDDDVPRSWSPSGSDVEHWL